MENNKRRRKKKIFSFLSEDSTTENEMNYVLL